MGIDISTTIFIGICNGIGTAIGSYLATKYAIQRLESISKRIKAINGDGS